MLKYGMAILPFCKLPCCVIVFAFSLKFSVSICPAAGCVLLIWKHDDISMVFKSQNNMIISKDDQKMTPANLTMTLDLEQTMPRKHLCSRRQHLCSRRHCDD